MTPPRSSRIFYNSWKLGKQLVGETACRSWVPLFCLVLNYTFDQRTDERQPLTFEILCLLAGGRPVSGWQLVPSICGPIQKAPLKCWIDGVFRSTGVVRPVAQTADELLRQEKLAWGDTLSPQASRFLLPGQGPEVVSGSGRPVESPRSLFDDAKS